MCLAPRKSSIILAIFTEDLEVIGESEARSQRQEREFRSNIWSLPAKAGGLTHPISLVTQSGAKCLSSDIPEGLSGFLGGCNLEKPFSEELNLFFGNIFEPQEMLVLRGHISASFRKHSMLEIQKTCRLSFTRSHVQGQLLAYMCVSKEKT